jgi:two-component system KDP operon response regulator KdpE
MTRDARILLVDDELPIQKAVAPLLEAQGYQVRVAGTGAAALDAVRDEEPDLIVLDLGLPDIDGGEVCRRLRAQSKTMPIIVLSARGAEADKVRALDLGADDYVTKPFGPEELLARLRVALRRVLAAGPEGGTLTIGDLTIDYNRRHVRRGGEEIRLTPKEFDLLSLLAKNHDRVLTHRAILKAIWGPHAVDQPEHLWVLVAQVRKKIELDPASPRYLLSEPWVGYRFVAE